MSTSLLEEPEQHRVTESSSSARLRNSMAAVRISFTWLGVRKALTQRQKKQAADSFGAEQAYLSAGKKLLDTSHPAFKAVTAIRGRITNYWKAVSLPFPEPGIRLIRQDSIESFDIQINAFREELDQAVTELDQHYDELRSTACNRLGDLFNASDYPASLFGMFTIEHDFPSIEPPNYLKQLNPELYEQECRRVESRFSEAVQLTETAFTEELAKLVQHITQKLSGDENSKPKRFRGTAVTNLNDFFERFRTLNIGSNEELDQLVDRAQQIVRGVEPQQLRDSQSLRSQIATQLSSVQTNLDDLLVDRPRRNILRRPK